MSENDLRLLNHLLQGTHRNHLNKRKISAIGLRFTGESSRDVFYLFSLYSTNIMRKTARTEGIKIHGLSINKNQYSDDTVLMVDSTQDLQRLLSLLKSEIKNMSLTINKKKTKRMVRSTTSLKYFAAISSWTKNTQNRQTS